MRYQKHTDLPVYQLAFELARTLFALSKEFPKTETYSLTDQCRRSSRSVCANLAEAWRKRRYEAAFAAKLNDAEAEAAETQVWLQFAVDCEYTDRETAVALYAKYDEVIRQIVHLIHHANEWTIKRQKQQSE